MLCLDPEKNPNAYANAMQLNANMTAQQPKRSTRPLAACWLGPRFVASSPAPEGIERIVTWGCGYRTQSWPFPSSALIAHPLLQLLAV